MASSEHRPVASDRFDANAELWLGRALSDRILPGRDAVARQEGSSIAAVRDAFGMPRGLECRIVHGPSTGSPGGELTVVVPGAVQPGAEPLHPAAWGAEMIGCKIPSLGQT